MSIEAFSNNDEDKEEDIDSTIGAETEDLHDAKFEDAFRLATILESMPEDMDEVEGSIDTANDILDDSENSESDPEFVRRVASESKDLLDKIAVFMLISTPLMTWLGGGGGRADDFTSEQGIVSASLMLGAAGASKAYGLIQELQLNGIATKLELLRERAINMQQS